jgi:hypothetical protein
MIAIECRVPLRSDSCSNGLAAMQHRWSRFENLKQSLCWQNCNNEEEDVDGVCIVDDDEEEEQAGDDGDDDSMVGCCLPERGLLNTGRGRD